MIEQARLFNLLVDPVNHDQLNTSDSILPPSKLPMDLSKEERKSQSNKRVLSEVDVNEWEIAYKAIHPRESKRSCNTGNSDQLIENETRSQAEILEERMRKSLCPYHQRCFKCGESSHVLQFCPSSAWSDPRDWNILYRQGKRIGLSKDFLKSRYSLQQLMDQLAHGGPQARREPQAHPLVSKPQGLPPRFYYYCRQPGHFIRDCLNPH
jgi:hypothetical protein